METKVVALMDEAGKLKSTEDTLQQARKMDAIGQLAGGVAHDLNNVLGAIMSNIELAEPGLDSKTRHYLQNAQQAADRGATLTGHLLAFARKQPMHREAYDLERLGTAFSDLVTRSIGSGVVFSMELPADIWAVTVDATQFEIALQNVALNAGQAMPDGGRLVIAATNHHADSLSLPGDLASGDFVCVSMRDSGAGMSPEIVARAFEPFFTTKAMGKGTGLGLSRVYGFSKQVGGTATLSSSLGSGTLVEMWLPRSVTLVEVPPLPVVLDNQARQQNRVLVVDDDPLMLEATGEVLRNLGYDVVEADSALRGLEIMSNQPTLSMLVTDFAMPKMNGVELISMVRRDHPTLPCLLMTGYADTSSIADVVAEGVPILQKPFRMSELAESMDRLWVN